MIKQCTEVGQLHTAHPKDSFDNCYTPALPYPLDSSPPIHGQSAMKRLRTRFLVGTPTKALSELGSQKELIYDLRVCNPAFCPQL